MRSRSIKDISKQSLEIALIGNLRRVKPIRSCNLLEVWQQRPHTIPCPLFIQSFSFSPLAVLTCYAETRRDPTMVLHLHSVDHISLGEPRG